MAGGLKGSLYWPLYAVLIFILLAGCMGSGGEGLTEAEEKELANQSFAYIEEVFLKPQSFTGEFKGIEPYGEELYVLNFTFGGRGMPQTPTHAYITSSGQMFIISQIVDTAELPEMPAPTESPAPTEPERADVSIGGDKCLGSEAAPVTIIEFSDYQCPYCQKFWEQTMPQIKSEYIDTGKVKFIYRDFPLGFHANAQKAAEATECASEQDRFWEMHDKVFGGMGEWSSGDVVNITKRYASELELDADEFADCLDTGKYTEEVQKDMADGAAAGVSGTPAFFVNGILLAGAHPFETFKQVIEDELADGGADSTISGTCG